MGTHLQTEKLFNEALDEQAMSALVVTGRILSGDEAVPEAARKTALSMISSKLKQDSNFNGRITRIISVTKLGVRDVAVREAIALEALRSLLPDGIVPRASAANPRVTMLAE